MPEYTNANRLNYRESTAFRELFRKPVIADGIELNEDIDLHSVLSDIESDEMGRHSSVVYAVLEMRNSIPKIKIENYEEKSPIDMSDIKGTQEFLAESGYDLGSSGVDGILGRNTKKAIQRFLLDKNYDIGQDIYKNPIDGIIGGKTISAIEQLQNDVEGNSYKIEKPGLYGMLGECSEDQCSMTVQSELAKNFGISNSELYNKYGVAGNAWDMKDNIVAKGGEIIFDKNVTNLTKISPGNVVQIYTGGTSEYQDKAGAGNPTHVAVVESHIKKDNDGREYVDIKHNLHRKKLTGGFQGRMFRDKLYIDDMSISGHSNYEARSIVAPAIKEMSKPIKGDPNVSIRPISDINDVESNAIFKLNDIDTKTELMNDFSLSEEEYNSLAPATLGIIMQETGFGDRGKIPAVDDNIELALKEIAASTIRTLIFDKTETSIGYGRVKFDTNFSNKAEDIERKYGLTKFNTSSAVDDGSNSAVATFLVLADHFKKLKNKYDTDEALYLAIQKYNRYNLRAKYGEDKKNSIEYAKDRDLSYSNKVLMYADKYLPMKEGAVVSNIVSRLNESPDVISKQIPYMIKLGTIPPETVISQLSESISEVKYEKYL